MLLKLLFIVTAGFTFVNLFKIIGLIFGNGMNTPFFAIKRMKIYWETSDAWVLYPCLFYQIYWWATYANLI